MGYQPVDRSGLSVTGGFAYDGLLETNGSVGIGLSSLELDGSDLKESEVGYKYGFRKSGDPIHKVYVKRFSNFGILGESFGFVGAHSYEFGRGDSKFWNVTLGLGPALNMLGEWGYARLDVLGALKLYSVQGGDYLSAKGALECDFTFGVLF